MHARSRPVLLFERLLPGSSMSCRDAGGPSAALHSVVNPAGPSTTRWRLSADHYLSPQERGSSRRFTRSPRRRGHGVGRRLCLRQIGPTETSAICPLSGESDIAERSSSSRDYEYPPEHSVARSQFQYRSRRLEADHVKCVVGVGRHHAWLPGAPGNLSSRIGHAKLWR